MRNLVLLSFLALAIWTTPALAATHVVNSLTDDGDGACAATCTLRDAIAGSAGGDTISIGVAGPITLAVAKGEIEVAHTLYIVGLGAAETEISGDRQIRIFNLTSGDVTIRELTLSNGLSAGQSANWTMPGAWNGEGGAIRVGADAFLVLENAILTGHKATGGAGANANPKGSGAGGGDGGLGGAFNSGAGGAGKFGGGGGGGAMGSGTPAHGGAGGFGGGGGGAGGNTGEGRLGGAGGTGGGAGGDQGDAGAFGGGGGGAGLGGAIFNEGVLWLNNVQFDTNTAQGGNGGNSVTYGGGGGGGAAMGSAVFAMGPLCISGTTDFRNDVLTRGAGGTVSQMSAGVGTGGQAINTSLGIYETVDAACEMSLVTLAPVTSTYESRNPVNVAFSADVTSESGVPTGNVTFSLENATGQQVGSEVIVVLDAGQAAAVFEVPTNTAAGNYFVRAQFTPANVSFFPGEHMLPFTIVATPSISRITELPEGHADCPAGGVWVESGPDDGFGGGIALDGILQDDEVNAETTNCNPVPPEEPKEENPASDITGTDAGAGDSSDEAGCGGCASGGKEGFISLLLVAVPMLFRRLRNRV